MLLFVLVETLHLSPHQMYSVRGLLRNPALTVAQRQSIQNILYTTHNKWAIKKAIEFKELHRYKCRDLPTEDLILSSNIGLLKSSRKYNGLSVFNQFAEIYIKSELLRTMTTHISITSCISNRDRMRSTNTTSAHRTVTAINTRVTKSDQPTPLANIQQIEFYRNSWAYVDTLDVFTKRVIWLKYDCEFKVKNTNIKIAELMCCSEETVRKSVIKFSDGIRQEVLCSYISV